MAASLDTDIRNVNKAADAAFDAIDAYQKARATASAGLTALAATIEDTHSIRCAFVVAVASQARSMVEDLTEPDSGITDEILAIEVDTLNRLIELARSSANYDNRVAA